MEGAMYLRSQIATSNTENASLGAYIKSKLHLVIEFSHKLVIEFSNMFYFVSVYIL